MEEVFLKKDFFFTIISIIYSIFSTLEYENIYLTIIRAGTSKSKRTNAR